MSDEREKIINTLIAEMNKFDVTSEVKEDTNIIEVVDSLDVMNYIFFLEEEYGLEISDEQVAEDNILVISTTADLILRKNN